MAYPRFRRLAGAMIAAGALGVSAGVHAATYYVNNLDDSGAGSFRAAINTANAADDPDRIEFDPALNGGTITLATALPALNEPVDVAGPGASDLTIDAGGNGSVLVIDAGGAHKDFSVSGLTLTGGDAAVGGGIHIAWSGSVVLTDVTVTGNTATDYGGGIALATTGLDVTIEDSRISGNQAEYWAGLYNGRCGNQLTVRRTTIDGNTAAGRLDSKGGGLGACGELTIVDSTISGNSAVVGGGGVHFLLDASPAIAFTNTTISGNDGGGILIEDRGTASAPTLTLTNVTLAANAVTTTDPSAPMDEGLVRGVGLPGTFTLTVRNTIVADNGRADCNAPGIIDTGNHNLDSDGSCGLAGADDLGDTAPDLEALADNGGPTQTHALTAGSPAVDAGDPLVPGDSGSCPTTDQRGEPRPTDGDGDGGDVCDIGAYERAALAGIGGGSGGGSGGGGGGALGGPWLVALAIAAAFAARGRARAVATPAAEAGMR